MERIVVGNGSAELIWLVALAYLRAADQVLIVGPTFGEYRRVCQIMSAVASDILAIAETNFQPPVNDIIAAVETLHPRVVFLCNPNNPTGVYLPRKDIERIVAAGRDTLWAIDEAYLPFVNKPDSLLHLADERNIMLLRSMTKDSALAGLRLGYSVSHPSIAANVERVRPPWSVNAMAQAAGLASLGDEGHLKKSQEIVAGSRAYLTAELKALGFVVYPSSANFILSEVPRFSGLDTAAHWRARLLVHGVCVRDCASFGLPRHIRLGIRTIPECQRLIEAIAGVIADG
jgi:histidinol-phosphate aminotransferase